MFKTEKSVYTVEEIQHKLMIGKRQAYELVNSGQFPVLKINSSYRIPIKTFDEWFYRKTESCTKTADAVGAKKYI